jgi:hypothetical protein
MAIGRFQVMALLQAARAYTLGLPLESARSWGLNRAIFYAAAERGFRGGGTGDRGSGSMGTNRPRIPGEPVEYRLGADLAFRDGESTTGKPIFTIGGERQTEERFQRQIEARFTPSAFSEAWKDALDYVQKFDRATLESPDAFFSDVYRPKRDEFAAKWTEAAASAAPTAGAGGGPQRDVAGPSRASLSLARRKAAETPGAPYAEWAYLCGFLSKALLQPAEQK